MRWVTNSEQHAYMKMRQAQNEAASKKNLAEAWAANRLRKCGCTWERQHLWGCRVFDFWSAGKHVAVEIDGLSHDGREDYDYARDYYNFLRSGILVYRIPSFDEVIMQKVREQLRILPPWRERKAIFGNPKDRQGIVLEAGLKLAHGNW